MDDLIKDFTGSVWILSLHVSTKVFSRSVLEIIASQNDNFDAYVELKSKKEKTRWYSSFDSNTKCGAKHTCRESEKRISYRNRINGLNIVGIASYILRQGSKIIEVFLN